MPLPEHYPLLCAHCLRVNPGSNTSCNHTTRTRYIILNADRQQGNGRSLARAVGGIARRLRRDSDANTEKLNRQNALRIWANTVARRSNNPYACWRHLRIPSSCVPVVPLSGKTRVRKLALHRMKGGKRISRMIRQRFNLLRRIVRVALRHGVEIRVCIHTFTLGQRLQMVCFEVSYEDHNAEGNHEDVEMQDEVEDDMGERNSPAIDWEGVNNSSEEGVEFQDTPAEEGHPLHVDDSSSDDPVDNPTLNEGVESEKVNDQTAREDSSSDTSVSSDTPDISDHDSFPNNDTEQDGFDDKTIVEDDSSDDAIPISEKTKVFQSPSPISLSPLNLGPESPREPK